jgi:hypothetical protein
MTCFKLSRVMILNDLVSVSDPAGVKQWRSVEAGTVY